MNVNVTFPFLHIFSLCLHFILRGCLRSLIEQDKLLLYFATHLQAEYAEIFENFCLLIYKQYPN